MAYKSYTQIYYILSQVPYVPRNELVYYLPTPYIQFRNTIYLLPSNLFMPQMPNPTQLHDITYK